MGFKEEQAAAAEQEAYEKFKLTYHGSGDPDEAWKMKKIIDEVDARAAQSKAKKPNEAAMRKIGDALSGAVTRANRFRSGDGMTDDERDDIIQASMKDVADLPAAVRTKVAEKMTGLVVGIRNSGDSSKANHTARSAAFRIAQDVPRTYEPAEDDGPSTADILAQMPRA